MEHHHGRQTRIFRITVESLRKWRQRYSIHFTLAVFVLFLLLNAEKTALFNLFLTDTEKNYPFKAVAAMFINAFVFISFLYLAVFRFRFSVFAIILYTFQLFFLTVNLIYFFYYQSYLHLNQYFELWAETLELMKHSAVPFEPGILVTLIDLPMFVYLVVFYKKIHTFNRTAAFRYSLYIPCILMLIGFAKWNVIKTDSPINLMNDRYMSETYVVKKFGIFTFNILNLLKIRDTNKLIRVLDQGDVIKGEGDSTKTPANILVIQIESMDAFSVNAKYRNNHVMPYLNSLSKKCVYYPFTLSYHKAGSTSDCEFSCINTTEPLDRFPSIKIRNYNFPNSVIKRFTKNKYDVEIFHGNRGDYFNRKIAFRKMGFPEFYDMNDMKLKEVVWGAPDENVLNFMTGKLKTAKQPFFFYIITMSSHEPFTFIEPYFRTKKFDGIKDARSKNYLTCLAYVDGVLKKFIGMIQSQYPDTYIIIFGDHTPGIFKGYYRQASLRFNDIYFEFVPLFIITPDNRVHYEKKRAVSFLDIAPTILAASNRPYEIKSFGMDLLADTAEWKPVPFRGQLYKREFLYKMISQELKRKPKKK